MRLISIGSASSCGICIPSQYVSSYHAELILLDNGDIFLVDCNSTNGTFLEGKRLKPNVEVPVRRGDRIEFDNELLNWASVPTIPLPDPSKVKGMYGVGKHERNRYCIKGDTVSRFHATIKEMKNGKWYIQDHSKNGTFINGNRIPSNQDIPLKAKDSIICGSVQCPNPLADARQGVSIPAWAWGVLAGVVVLALAVLGLSKMSFGHNTDPYRATVLVNQTFRIKVVFADDPVKSLLEVEDWYIPASGDQLATKRDDALVDGHSGTAFFISKTGLLLTNKHVTNWIYADEKYHNGVTTSNLRTLAEFGRQCIYSEFMNPRKYELTAEQMMSFDRWLKSPFTLEIETVSFGIRYSGRTYSSLSEFDWAHLVSESSDDDADVALLRLNSLKTPEACDWFDMKRMIKASDLKRDETYYTLGFPGGETFATALNQNKYEPTSGMLHLVQSPGRYTLFFQGDTSIGGQSGSPVYDKHHRLVGVLYGGFSAIGGSTNACPIVWAKTLVDEVLERDVAEQSFMSGNAF